MNCLEFRRLTLIDPNDGNHARLSHIAGCDACRAFAEQMLRQDALIREAVRVEPPEGFAARILLNQSLQPDSRPSRRVYLVALAASVLLALAVIPALIPGAVSLEEALASHSHAHDMLQASPIEVRSQEAEIAEILAVANTALPGFTGNIIEATTCVVDGQLMAHLIVQDDHQQFVLYLIPGSQLPEHSFTIDHWSGRTLPVSHDRSLAVLNRSGAGLTAAADRFSHQFDAPLTSGTTI